MKCEIVINENADKRVVIYTDKRSALTDTIQKLCADDDVSLIGYGQREGVLLDMAKVNCFIVEMDKVYALTTDGKYQLKGRLYQIEEMLSDNFIRINQSCIANIKMIKRFDASISGQLTVYFQNGYRDFVSRRNIKKIKQKFNI